MAVDVFARTLALASLGNGGGGSAVDTYTKAEIDRMFGEAGTVQVEAVDVLPTENIKENVIYLVPNGSSGENFYDECMYINNKWETIGTTEIDLSNYTTKDELEEALVDMVTVDVLNAYPTKEQVDNAVIQPATIINTDSSDKIKISNATTRTQVVEYFNKILTELNYDVLSPNNVIKSVVGPVDKFPVSLLIDGFLHPVLGISFKHYANNKVTVAFYIGDYVTSHNVKTANLQYSSVATFARYMFYLTEAEVKAKNIQTIYNIDGKANGDVPISAGSVKYIYNQPYNFIPTDNTTSYTPVGDYNPATKKYVDDTVGAIEIPSIEGLATEEYADAAGQKAFDDMAAIAGDVNSLTTETHETFAAAINEINAKVDSIGNQIVISSIEPLDATKDPNLINNYITQEELKEFHTRILNGGSGKIIFQGSVEDVTYVSHYVPQYPSPSMFFYCVNNYIGTPSTKDGATVYKEKYAPAFVLIYTEQTDTYSWGRTSQTSIEVPSVEGLATEEYVNEKIEEIAFTPNWNAQEGEEGYIENRTHYSNFTTSEVIYHPNSASFGLAAGNNGTYWFVHEINDADTIAKISAADKISINFLGTVVEGLEKKSKIVEEVEGQPQEGELITVYWFGNDYAFSAFSPVEGMQDTGEPVSILVDTSAILLCLRGTADDKGKTMFGTCVIEAVTESVKKLDNKYLDLDAYSTKEYVDAAIAASSSNVEVFEGTQEEYDALSDEEKAKYTIVVIDDGEEV